MILNKVKIGAIIALVLMAIKTFMPEVDVPEGLQDALLLVIVFVSQFFIKETEATRSRLKVK